MKRHFSTLVCALLAVSMVLSLASCNLFAPKHEHTYSNKWSSNGTSHWHAATCQAEDGCAIAIADVAAHSDADSDKICDVCDYDMGHEHTYSSSWSMDNDSHWHAASCRHNEISEKAAHDIDINGLCSVCGYNGDLGVSKAVSDGVKFKNLVKSAIVTYIYNMMEEGSEPTSSSISYEFGNGVTKIADEENVYWYALEGEDLFAVYEYEDWSGELVAAFNENAVIDSMNGYNFSNVFSSYGDEEFYGADGLVSGLYNLALKNFGGASRQSLKVVDDATYYVFKFATVKYFQTYDYEVWDYVDTDTVEYLYETEVMFTLTENSSIGNVKVTTNSYAVTEEVYNEETYEYEYVSTGIVELKYDETDATKIVSYKIVEDTASAVYTYEVAQTEGERTLEPKYTSENVLVSSFVLELEDGTPVSESIAMVAGTPLYLYLGQIAPATANLSLDSVNVSCEDFAVDGYYNEYSEAITISAYKVGTYEITVSTSNASVTFTAVVTAPATTSLGYEVDDEEVFEYGLYVATGSSASFIFDVIANQYADASCKVEIKDAPAGATLVKNNDNGTYTFTATATGTYEIVATSTVAEGVTGTLEVKVEEAPEVSDILNGYYSATIPGGSSSTKVIAQFVPASEGAVTGTLNITTNITGWESSSTSSVYTYEWANGSLNIAYVSGEEVQYAFDITDAYKVTVDIDGYGFYNDMAPYTPPTTEESVSGEYYYNVFNEDFDVEYRWSIVLYSDNTGIFAKKELNEDYEWVVIDSEEFTWSVVANDDGTYSITIVAADSSVLASGTYNRADIDTMYGGKVTALVDVIIDGTAYNMELGQ